jgi:hypothetical protein
LAQFTKAGEVAVGAALARVLGRRLAVHLQDAGAGTAEHPADEVDVVDLHRGGRGLVRLIYALEDGGEEGVGLAEDPGGLLDVPGRDAAQLGGVVGRIGRHGLLELVEPDGMGVDPVAVDPVARDQLAQ